MPIRRGNPFEEIEELLDRMSREFDPGTMTSSSVAVDVADRGDEYVVTADLPGYDRDDIEVTLADRTLRIDAERASDTEEETGEYIRRERRREAASRSVRLPEAVDEADVTATYTNGVLEIHLPKHEAGGGTRIDVE